MIKLTSVYGDKDAAKFLYTLLQEREGENDINISHSKCPSWAEHVAFIRSKPYRYWYLIDDRVVNLGYISATFQNEIGIVLSRDARGQGIGTEAVRQFIDTHEPLRAVPAVRSGHWLANINPNNTASIKLFTRLGARLVQHTYRFD